MNNEAKDKLEKKEIKEENEKTLIVIKERLRYAGEGDRFIVRFVTKKSNAIQEFETIIHKNSKESLLTISKEKINYPYKFSVNRILSDDRKGGMYDIRDEYVLEIDVSDRSINER